MLKLFREKKTLVRIFLFLIVGVVGLMMVVTLVPGLSGGGASLADPQGVLAQVGEAVVTQREVQQQYQRSVAQAGTQSPLFRQLMMERIVGDLITRRAVEYEAERLGMEVTSAEVTARLRQMSLFYPGGQFIGEEAYQRLVQQQFGLSTPAFEEQLRRGVLVGKLLSWVTSGVTVSSAEVEQEYRRRNEQVQVEFVLLQQDEFAQQLAPGEQELRPYFESNRERYQVPERRAVRFVPIDYELLRNRVEVTRSELEAYYQSHRDSYRVPERVRARHILFLKSRPAEAEAEQPEAVRKQAEQVLAQLQRGADFAALARQHSDDPATREQGGEIGWVLRGQAVPALEQALFSLEPGAAAQLVETSYGFHIVQVLEHQPDRVMPFEEVGAEIEPQLREQEVQKRAREEARQIVAAVRAGKTLPAAARELGWFVRESPLFTRDDVLPQFGANQDFQQAAFSLPAESAGKPGAPVSDPVAVPAGYAVLQLKEVSEAHQASFEEVRDKVAQTYRQERAGQQARETAERLAAEAQESGELRGPAQRLGLTVKASQSFSRDGTVSELGSVSDIAPVAFSLPVGGISSALPFDGKWAVLRVTARQEADLSKLTPQERETIRENLLGEKRNLAWTLFYESLKKRLQAEGKLQLNQAAINRLTGRS